MKKETYGTFDERIVPIKSPSHLEHNLDYVVENHVLIWVEHRHGKMAIWIANETNSKHDENDVFYDFSLQTNYED